MESIFLIEKIIDGPIITIERVDIFEGYVCHSCHWSKLSWSWFVLPYDDFEKNILSLLELVQDFLFINVLSDKSYNVENCVPFFNLLLF